MSKETANEPRPEAIHQLSDGDSIFVSMETTNSPSHIGGLAILDPSDSKDFSFERFVKTTQDRIRMVPRFGWKLREVPFGMDRPYWVEDEKLDISRHIKRIALPSPGDEDTLSRAACMLHERPLDRSRPLWEMYWIEGLQGGRVAVFSKVHHALIDGESGVGLFEVLMDFAVDATTATIVPESMKESAPVPPDDWEIMRRAARNGAIRPVKLLEHAARGLGQVAASWLDGDDESATEVPRLRFNEKIGPDRAFAFASISLDDVLAVKKHFEASMNEVLLELVGSSLRRALRAGDELPKEPLIASCPVSKRAKGDDSLGNQVTNMNVSLATHLEDPADRLREIQRRSKIAKKAVEKGSFDILAAIGESLAPAPVNLLMNFVAQNVDKAPLPANLVFSNVRGIPVPVFVAGARVERLFPMSLLQAGNGLNITVVSSENRLDFGIVTDAQQWPNPWPLADGLALALDELKSAINGVQHISA